MKTSSWAILGVIAGSLWMAAPAAAHHSFAAEYDAGKPITLSGTVTKVQWTNPHARLNLDVKGSDGKVTNWDFELGSPNALIRRGWSRSALKIGDTITVSGYAAKDGSSMANARSVTMSDGRKVFGGSAEDDGPAQ